MENSSSNSTKICKEKALIYGRDFHRELSYGVWTVVVHLFDGGMQLDALLAADMDHGGVAGARGFVSSEATSIVGSVAVQLVTIGRNQGQIFRLGGNPATLVVGSVVVVVAFAGVGIARKGILTKFRMVALVVASVTWGRGETQVKKIEQ